MREIRSTGASLSPLGLGTVPLSGFGHPTSYEEFEAVILAAYEAGIRYFDTAPMYGAGRSEHFLGHILRTKGLREKVTLSTKVGRLLKAGTASDDGGKLFGITWIDGMPFAEHYDYTYDGIMRSFEDSQQRFGMDRFDILHVHDIGKLTHTDKADFYWQQLRDGGYRALDEIRAAGGTKAVGIGVNETDAIEQMASEFDLDCCLLAGRYSLLNQGPNERFFPEMQTRNIAIIAAGVFNSGILGGGSKGSTRTFDYMQAPPAIIAKVEALEAICDRHGIALPEAALQFAAAHPAISCILQGCKNVDEVRQNATAAARPIPADLWQEMKHEGLIPQDAPVPQNA